MSATMARQGGQVQLKHSHTHEPLIMANLAKGVVSHAVVDETQYLINEPRSKVRELTMRGVEFPGHKMEKAARDRHPAMLPQNHTAGCLICQNSTTNICRHAGDAKEQVYLGPTNSDSRLQKRHHLCLENHPPHQVTLPELNTPKS